MGESDTRRDSCRRGWKEAKRGARGRRGIVKFSVHQKAIAGSLSHCPPPAADNVLCSLSRCRYENRYTGELEISLHLTSGSVRLDDSITDLDLLLNDTLEDQKFKRAVASLLGEEYQRRSFGYRI